MFLKHKHNVKHIQGLEGEGVKILVTALEAACNDCLTHQSRDPSAVVVTLCDSWSHAYDSCVTAGYSMYYAEVSCVVAAGPSRAEL